MKLGAHVSIAGGLGKAVDRGRELGCETIQIFGSSPQTWAYKPVPQEQTRDFRERAKEASISPVFLHAIYLINLGTPNVANLEKGIDSLINYMNLASEVEADGVILHPGSHGGAGYEGIFEQTVASIERVLENSPPGPWLTLENTAGMGQHIGARFEELGRIIAAVSPTYPSRLKVCLDTQHCFAAGYDVSTKEGLESMLAAFDACVGLDNLVAVHANDSKYALRAGIDHHENIGQGYIRLEGFENIMGHPAFQNVPFFLEVPGLEKKGPDKENLEILKEMRARMDEEGRCA